MHHPHPIGLVASLLFSIFCLRTASAAVLFTEGFESPTLTAGGTTTSLPSGWLSYSGPSVVQYVFHPTGGTRFSSNTLLQSPADGNQMMVLGRTNSGIYRMSASTILGSTQYQLSAAIGNSLLEDKDEFWSLQLWADINDNNLFDAGDSFLSQQFGTSGTASNATAGGWAVNSTLFDSNTQPSVVGKKLILFLNNYGDAFSESYYDNVTLSIVPEPSRALLMLVGLAAAFLRRHRHPLIRSSKAASPAPHASLANTSGKKICGKKCPNLEFLSFAAHLFASLLVLSSHAQTPVVAQKLAQLRIAYEAAYQKDVAASHQTAIADLDAKYTAALDRALVAATQAGQLDTAVALRDEKKRLTDKAPLPGDDFAAPSPT